MCAKIGRFRHFPHEALQLQTPFDARAQNIQGVYEESSFENVTREGVPEQFKKQERKVEAWGLQEMPLPQFSDSLPRNPFGSARHYEQPKAM